MEPRFDIRSHSEVRSPGSTPRKRELSLLPYAGWRYDFKCVRRPNQFDQFIELGQHEKSRRGILSRHLTCDHLPKAVLQGIRRGRGRCCYCLTQAVDMISKVSRDLINSISFLSYVNIKSRVVVY